MSSVGRISLDLNVNSRGFNRQVNNIERQTTKAFSSMSVAVGNIMANLAQKAVASIGNFVKDSINAGSELAELENVVDSVFTTMANKVDAFSKSALEAYGLTEKQAKKMVGTFGAMSQSFGYNEAQSYSMSTALTALAGDIASFYNLDHDEAYTKLKSVFTGETESLKELGVVMTQTALDEFALANGFGKTTAKMSEQEKVALRLAFVQDKLKTATGDFTKTQDQWANQTRILTGQFESFKASIGQGLINVLTPVIKVLNTLMSKLVQVGNAFKSFTEMIMGTKKSGGGAGAAMAEVADAASTAADATGGIEDAASGAATAAKTAQKSLMGFDEINKLSKPDEGADSGSGSGVSFDDIAFGEAVATQEEITNAAIDGLKSKVQELIDLFKDGFSAGLGEGFEESIANIKKHASGIGTGLADIFTDPKVTGAASEWANKVVYALGQVVGSITSIGASIAEALLGGIDTFLSQNGDFIKDRIAGMFDVSGECYATIGNLWEAFASIFEVFRGPETKQIIADLLGIVSNAALGVQELALQIGSDIINCIAQPIIDNKDKIKEAIENALKPISKILSTLNKAVKDTFESIQKVYKASIKPMFKAFADGISSIVGTVLDAYNTHIAPVLDKLATKFSEVWESTIQPLLDKAIGLIGKLCDIISVLWNDILVPLINWIVQYVVPVLAPIFETIGNLFFTLLETISQIISGIMDVLGGIIDFIVGVFTGDWERAWEGIKSIFTGIWDAIVGIFSTIWETLTGIVTVALDVIKGAIEVAFNAIKGIVSTVWNIIKGIFTTVIDAIAKVVEVGFNLIKGIIEGVMNAIKAVIAGVWNAISGIINGIFGGIEFLVNGIIGAINFIIRAINNLSFDVPDWVPGIGGETFGFNIKEMSEVSLPRLPYLAEGGYVRANQPQTVVVGDNKRHGEIISPEDKMLAVTLQALEQFFSRLKESGYSSNNNGEVGDIIIPIYLDGSALDEVIVTAQQRRNMRSGGR